MQILNLKKLNILLIFVLALLNHWNNSMLNAQQNNSDSNGNLPTSNQVNFTFTHTPCTSNGNDISQINTDFENCSIDIGPRISGGDISFPGEIPYQVSLKLFGHHKCGGTIISERTIVTAAHCILPNANLNLARYIVTAGIFKLGVPQVWEQERALCELTAHPQYNRSRRHSPNDIAILVVCQPFRFNDYVNRIGAIQVNRTVTRGGTLQVSGWGKTSEGVFSTALRKAKLKPRRDATCQTTPCVRDFYDSVSMICAGGGFEGSCKGDSGGPLVLLPYRSELGNMTKYHTLVGIVSWGCGCGLLGQPRAYTRVSHYTDFIKANSGAKSLWENFILQNSHLRYALIYAPMLHLSF